MPKIGSGDWNDGFSEVGNKGKGESVWLGFFLYTILDRFIELIKSRITSEDNEENKKLEEYVQKYQLIMQDLRKTLNKNGWDGRWYRRALYG